MRTNLMSVSKITDQGHEVTFTKNVAYVKNKKEEIVAEATRKGEFYFIRGNSEVACIADGETKSKLMEWHERLGHVNEVSLKNMANKNIALGMKFPKNPELGICEIYIYIL